MHAEAAPFRAHALAEASSAGATEPATARAVLPHEKPGSVLLPSASENAVAFTTACISSTLQSMFWCAAQVVSQLLAAALSTQLLAAGGTCRAG